MYNKIWNECRHSICSISFLDLSNKILGSGTGFKVQNCLVTNNHVYNSTQSAFVELKFVDLDGFSIKAIKKLAYEEFRERIIIGLPETSWDYAIIRLDDEEFKDIRSLKLNDSKSISIGSDVAILGYQFEQSNLSIKQGILSSRYLRAGVKYMQVDASVNHGNSGGPLIDILTNSVVGIVTRKHTGLTQAFDELLKSFDTNINIIRAASRSGGITIGGVNPMDAIILNQQQMKYTAKEIQRSSNVGIGYAYELDFIKDYFDNN